jgi:hypothetical protein
MKQHQNRTGVRAPHGSPEFTERIAFYCTAAQKKKFMKNGSSAWARQLIAQAPNTPLAKQPRRGD